MAAAVASLHSLLGRSSVDDHDEALRVADAALSAARADEDIATARHAKAVALLKLDRFDDALRVLADHPDQGDFCLLERAYALYKTGQLGEARALCRRAAESSRGLRHVAAQAAYRADDFLDAEELYGALTADTKAVMAMDESADLRVNELAVQAQLGWSGLSDPAALASSREDMLAFETTYNYACVHLGRGEYRQADILLMRARHLCESSEELSDEDKKAELLPIKVQQMLVLARQGKLSEAAEIQKSIDISEIPEGSTKAVAEYNSLVLGDETNPYMVQRLAESIKTPSSGSDRLFQHQADIMQRNRYIIELQCHKFKGVAKNTAKRIAADKEAGRSTLAGTTGLGVLNAAAHANLETGKGALARILPLLETRPDDVGLLLTIIQLYIQTKNPGPAISLLEAFFKRLEAATTPDHADVRFAPGLVALAVGLYKLQGRHNAVRSELSRAVAHWQDKAGSHNSGASLLREAGVELLRSHNPSDLATAGAAFERLSSSNPSDRVAHAGLVASFAASDYAKVEPHLESLMPVEKLTKDVDVGALLTKGVASLAPPPAPSSSTGQKRPAADADADAEPAAGGRKKRRRTRKLPKDYDPNRKMDPERWLPLRDRSSYRPKGRKGKKRAAEATQGGMPVGGAGAAEETLELAGGAGSVRVEKAPQGGASGGKKKKKGKK
ncbi:uncharacterized protein E0L32_004692 [Thyridium curvatum]|uniref:Signal recognition particle subunit SRP72 n=1 Tax=Thyridium curvatum TaxID=1093900 RepID=A0A507B943_9PEZI|nr:uncharacterized protein E0L32_004692 [Thyridium curvatum]TPX15134.1 hypothetical protein E0L32_004692 [Thyridium curvatum]